MSVCLLLPAVVAQAADLSSGEDAGLPGWFVPASIVGIIFWWLCWTALAKRLGHAVPALLGFMMLLPFINLIVLAAIAFSESPNEKQLRILRWQQRKSPGAQASRESQEVEPPPAPLTECPACGSPLGPNDARCPDCDLSLR